MTDARLDRAALTVGTGKSSDRVEAAIDMAASPDVARPSRSEATVLASGGSSATAEHRSGDAWRWMAEPSARKRGHDTAGGPPKPQRGLVVVGREGLR